MRGSWHAFAFLPYTRLPYACFLNVLLLAFLCPLFFETNVYAATGLLGANGDGAGLAGIQLADGSQILGHINSVTGELRVTENRSGAWNSITIASSFDGNGSVALLQLGGDIHLFALNARTGVLADYIRSGSTWAAPQTISSNAAGKISAALRGSDLLVTFADKTNANLQLARKGNNWSVTTIDASADDVGFESSIAVSSSSQIGIAYLNRTKDIALFASSSDAVSWSLEAIRSPTNFIGSVPSLRWATDGTWRILTGDVIQSDSIGGRGLYHLEKRPGSTWAQERIGFPSQSGASGVILSGDTRIQSAAVTRNRGVSSLFLMNRSANGLWSGTLMQSSTTESYSRPTRVKDSAGQDVFFVRSASSSFTGIRFITADSSVNSTTATPVAATPVAVTPLATATPGAISLTPTATATPSATNSPTPLPIATPIATSTPASTPTPTPTTTSSTVFKINSGGGGYTDSTGGVWSGDRYFSSASTYSTGATIGATTNQTIYKSERYGANFSYNLPVSNGSYNVVLHFSEIYFTAAGKRVFSVNAEGRAVLSNLDIYAAVGANTALSRTIPVQVSDGTLNLAFIASKDNAKVSAIEVVRVTTVTPTPTPTPNPTPTATVSATPTPTPTSTVTLSTYVGLNKLCATDLLRDGFSSFVQIRNVSTSSTSALIQLTRNSGAAVASVTAGLGTGASGAGEIVPSFVFERTNVGLQCSIYSTTIEAKTALLNLAAQVGRSGAQEIVFEPLTGLLPITGVKADAMIVLANPTSSVSTGTVRVLDRNGLLRSAFNISIGAQDYARLPLSLFIPDQYGQLEWRPDSGTLKTYFTIEQKIERTGSGVLTSARLARTDGVSISSQLSRTQVSQSLTASRQSADAINITVSVF